MVFVKCIVFSYFTVMISINAFTLTNYVTKCNITDPKIHECVTKESNKFWQYLIKAKGDKTLGIPPLEAVNHPDVNLNIPSDFKFTMKNVFGHGFALMKINKLVLDFEKNKFSLMSFIPNAYWEGNYTADGLLENQTFKDYGYLTSSYINLNLEFIAELKTIVVNGIEYLHVEKGSFKFEPEKIVYKLWHPDGTDEIEANKLSQLINENYDTFSKYYVEIIKGVGNSIFPAFINNIFKVAAKNELFDS